MNSRRLLSLLLLLFVLCFGLFSASYTAHATTSNLTPNVDSEIAIDNGVTVMSTDDVASTIDNFTTTITARKASDLSYITTLSDKTIKAGQWGQPYEVTISDYRWSDYVLQYLFTYDKNHSLICSKGSSVKFNLSNFVLSTSYIYNGQKYTYNTIKPEFAMAFDAFFLDANGNYFKHVSVPLTEIHSYGIGMMSLSFDSGTLDKDLYSIQFRLRFTGANSLYNGISSLHWNNGSNFKLFTGTGSSSMIECFVEDGTKSLLKDIKNGISNLINGITELPSKLWGLIDNGLKGLFVPSETQMTEVKGQWDSLLSDRFGGLYQTVQLIDDYAETFKEPSVSQTSIDFPEFRLNVGSDSEFVLQAHDVQIVPDRFSFLVDVLKTIISIIATCLFVNGLRNKFERLVGGHE